MLVSPKPSNNVEDDRLLAVVSGAVVSGAVVESGVSGGVAVVAAGVTIVAAVDGLVVAAKRIV